MKHGNRIHTVLTCNKQTSGLITARNVSLCSTKNRTHKTGISVCLLTHLKLAITSTQNKTTPFCCHTHPTGLPKTRNRGIRFTVNSPHCQFAPVTRGDLRAQAQYDSAARVWRLTTGQIHSGISILNVSDLQATTRSQAVARIADPQQTMYFM